MSPDKTRENQQRLLDKEVVRLADKLKIMMDTQGWKDVVVPLLDKMIEDVVGSKVNGRWNPGAFGDKTLTEEKAQNLLWYRQALIDFHRHIHSYLDLAEQVKKDKQEGQGPVKYNNPMMHGPYFNTGNPGNSVRDYSYSVDEDGGING